VHAVVTDVEMPGRNGFQLVEAIRAQGSHARLPVIALSSGVTPDQIERARRLHIAEFVAKFDRSGLVAALAETQSPMGEAA
jgi:two-component system chemotaxis sensor kinase CheA